MAHNHASIASLLHRGCFTAAGMLHLCAAIGTKRTFVAAAAFTAAATKRGKVRAEWGTQRLCCRQWRGG